MEKINTVEQSEKNVTEEVSFNPEVKEKKEQRNYEERVDETFGDLDSKGETFKSGDKIDFIFMNEQGKKIDCEFDIDNQSLLYNDTLINISMPRGATITEIQFTNGNINIKGKLGIFSGSGQTEDINLLKAIDTVVKKGNSQIITEKGNIGFSKL